MLILNSLDINGLVVISLTKIEISDMIFINYSSKVLQ